MGKIIDRLKTALQPKVTAKGTATITTQTIATFDQHCWLCKVFIPANTYHKCGITNAPPKVKP